MNNPMTHWSVRTLFDLSFAGSSPVRRPCTTAPCSSCKVETINYEGRQAQQGSNPWVKLIFVPQNGGPLMQVVFDDHPFLFVSPAHAGKYVPSSHNEWFN
jgi:hypothetical protein